MGLRVAPARPSRGPDGARNGNGAANTGGAARAGCPRLLLRAERAVSYNAAKTDDATGLPPWPANPCVSGSRLPLLAGYCIAFSLSLSSLLFLARLSRLPRCRELSSSLAHWFAHRFVRGVDCEEDWFSPA